MVVMNKEGKLFDERRKEERRNYKKGDLDIFEDKDIKKEERRKEDRRKEDINKAEKKEI